MNVYSYTRAGGPVLLLVSMAMLTFDALAQARTASSPLRTWGEISSTYRARDYVGIDSQATNWLNTASLYASSYLWRPWFATAQGGLTLSLDQSDFSDQPSEENQYLTGNMGLNLFPGSRFPSQLYYAETRNELDDDLLKRDIETTELSLRQQYRTVDNAHRMLGEYINATRKDPTAADIEGNRVLFSANSQLENHTLGTDLQADTVEDSFQREKSDSYAITARHGYTDQGNFTVDNLVSTSSVENDFVRSVTDIETAEFSSLMSWRPGAARNLSITGNLRLSDQLLQQTDDLTTPNDESASSDTETANLNQGLIYQYSDALRLRQTINANRIESGDSESVVISEAVGFDYIPERIDLAIGDYGWNIGASYVHDHGDVDNNNTVNSRFSHSLDNRYTLGEGRRLRTSLSQTLSNRNRQRGFDRSAIDHSFLATWTQSTNVDQAVVSLLLSDSRAKEDDDELFQIVNLQFSGLLRFDRYTQLSGNATLQWTWREDGGDESRDTVTNGRLEYLRNRLYDVPRLVFRSTLTLSRQQSETEQLVGEIIDNEENDESWENSLEYLIGRLETSVNVDFVKSNGDYDRIFKIQFIRSFGDL